MQRVLVVLCALLVVAGMASAALGAQRGAGKAGLGVAVVEPAGAGSVRIWGANRYATAAAVSEANWTYDTTLTVFLATGQNPADALAVGPSTFMEGPLLLTEAGALPPETRAELERLRPCRVVVVGGPGAISDAVVAEADAYTEPEACATEVAP